MMNAPRCNVARVSVVGDRALNQDRCVSFSKNGNVLLALGDGLGGHPRGEVAAQLLMDVCEIMFRRCGGRIRDPENFILKCLQQAHEAIVRFGKRQEPPIAPRTTAVVTLIQRGVAHWCHAGDSRLYLIRDGHAMAQTRDHTAIRYLKPPDGRPGSLRSSITHCLGGLGRLPAVTAGPSLTLEDGDIILLCSDGFWGQLIPRRLIAALSAADDIQQCLHDLAQEALRNAAPRSDNVTAVCLRWGEAGQWSDSNPDEPGLAMDEDQDLHAAIRHLRSVVLGKTKN